ncbi:putative protein kinase RLK-Pelle-RLCK-IXa family [Lupinus albus]|uniref:non-specific serine/threonine protein kinase n=1 Tax=Lupinus albus TaxID=3870 RepID=A0A6A4NE74_LUPAL|nr:putative protein kinase RLK-Pelle-RLCK-IXa family [Lupinus albus]
MMPMRLLWRLRLPLLILIQLLYPNKSTYKLYAEALFTIKSSQQFGCNIVNYPCQIQWPCLDCNKIKDPGGITGKLDGNNDIPTLTPLQDSQAKRPKGIRGAVIVGGIVASLIVVAILVIVYICLMRIKRLIRQTSETASSMPSPSVEMGRGNNSEYVNAFTPQKTRHITILELQQATRNFSPSNIIGEGGFGFVYKGLLEDGSIVAIKRRQFALTPDFIREVKQITHTHHIHLVKLIGYYEDRFQQLLVYEYLPNGNVGNHLYDNEGLPLGRLDFWRRLSIALGAAKGKTHLAMIFE